MVKEKSDKRKIINWVLNFLLVVLIIIGLYLFLSRIFGSSPTDFQLIIWIFGFFATTILKIFSLIYNINREVGELKISVRDSFDKIKKDINEIKQEIRDTKNIKLKK